MKDTVYTENDGYYDVADAQIYSKLFGCGIYAMAKKCSAIYAHRCEKFFDAIPAELLQTLLTATAAYITDLLLEHEDEYDLPEDFPLYEDFPVPAVLRWVEPMQIVFDRGILSEEDAPPAFSLKLMFSPVPDECIEWTVRDDSVVYVGEYSDISPWNEKILRKDYNYINRI